MKAVLRAPLCLLRFLPTQVGLIVLVALLMPRAGPSGLDAHAGSHQSGGLRRYAVVIDAGSTGSRVHAFEFGVDGAKQELQLLNDHFKQLKPGLSSFAADPKAGAASLKPLLEAALEAVPPLQAAVTPIEVRATAGLRLLPGAQADQLLAGALCCQPHALVVASPRESLGPWRSHGLTRRVTPRVQRCGRSCVGTRSCLGKRV